jgi:DNA-binding NtrC family response regulator
MLPNQLIESPPRDALPLLNLGELRTVAVKQALKTTKGHKGKAAKLLGVHANTLTRMLSEIEAEAEE